MEIQTNCNCVQCCSCIDICSEKTRNCVCSCFENCINCINISVTNCYYARCICLCKQRNIDVAVGPQNNSNHDSIYTIYWGKILLLILLLSGLIYADYQAAYQAHLNIISYTKCYCRGYSMTCESIQQYVEYNNCATYDNTCYASKIVKDGNISYELNTNCCASACEYRCSCICWWLATTSVILSLLSLLLIILVSSDIFFGNNIISYEVVIP